MTNKAKVSILPGTALDRLRQALEEQERRDITLDGGVDDKWATVKELGAVLAYLDEVKMEPEATRLIRLWGALGDACKGHKHPLLTPVKVRSRKKSQTERENKKRGVGRPPKETQTDREKEIRSVAAVTMQLFMDAGMPRDQASEEVGIDITSTGRKTKPAAVRHWRDDLIGRTDDEGKETVRGLGSPSCPIGDPRTDNGAARCPLVRRHTRSARTEGFGPHQLTGSSRILHLRARCPYRPVRGCRESQKK